MIHNLGRNIKHFRQQKKMTQEQLAQLLGVSAAAISKWEVGNSYPDISMLLPLAHIFSVTLDELMEFDQYSIQIEIETIVKNAREAHLRGDYEQAREILSAARKKYPHSYHIMHHYMWELAGGYADNSPQTLLKHKDEFLQICNCILSGCDQESLRLDALTMKAKLYQASGDTQAALEMLSDFPTWDKSQNQKREQLFPKDSPEFLYWNNYNTYGMRDGVFCKVARSIWYDQTLTSDTKKNRIELLGDSLFALSEQEGFAFLSISAQMLFSFLANHISSAGTVEDVIRIRDKQLMALERMYILSQTSQPLADALDKTYGTQRPAVWVMDWLKTAKHPQLAELRENNDYISMIKRWELHLRHA